MSTTRNTQTLPNTKSKNPLMTYTISLIFRTFQCKFRAKHPQVCLFSTAHLLILRFTAIQAVHEGSAPASSDDHSPSLLAVYRRSYGSYHPRNLGIICHKTWNKDPVINQYNENVTGGFWTLLMCQHPLGNPLRLGCLLSTLENGRVHEGPLHFIVPPCIFGIAKFIPPWK